MYIHTYIHVYTHIPTCTYTHIYSFTLNPKPQNTCIVPKHFTLYIGVKLCKAATIVTHSVHTYIHTYMHTAKVKRFTGMSFCCFHSFQDYSKSFSMNISASLQLYYIINTSGQGDAKVFP